MSSAGMDLTKSEGHILGTFNVLLGLLLGKSKNTNAMSQSVSYSPFKIQSEYLPLRDLFRKFLINICFKISQDQYLLGHK